MMMMRIGIIDDRFGASKVINQLNCRFQSIRVMTMVMMKIIYADFCVIYKGWCRMYSLVLQDSSKLWCV